MKKEVFFMLSGLLLFSCNPENNTEEVLPVAIYAEEFSVVIDENPSNNQLLGFIGATTNIGTVTYAISSESEEGAFMVEADTGKLRAADPSLFDFETSPVLTAVVAITNQDLTEHIDVTVTLNDVFDENERTLFEINISGEEDGPVFSDTKNRFFFNGNTLNRWLTFYIDAEHSVELEYNGQLISNYIHTVSGASENSISSYTFTYNANNLVSTIELVYEQPDIPLTETFTFNVIYTNLSATVLNTATNETVNIEYDIDRYIRRISSATKSLEFDYDVNNNLLSKIDQDGKEVRFSYDNKRNPFFDLSPMNFGVVHSLLFAVNFESRTDQLNNPANNGVWQSLNNITAIETSSCEESCINEASYNYTYNSDGYPWLKRVTGTDRVLEFRYQ